MADYIELSRMGDTALKEGNYKAALSYYEAVLRHVSSQHGESSLRAGECYANIGIAYYQAGVNKKAYKFLRLAEDVMVSELGEKHKFTLKIGLYLDLLEAADHKAKKIKKGNVAHETIHKAFQRMCIANQDVAVEKWVDSIISSFAQLDKDFDKYQQYYKRKVFKDIHGVMVEDGKKVSVLDFDEFDVALRERAYKAAAVIIKR